MSARERPIIFSAPMVRAILDGRKTQTRRALRDFDVHGDQLHTPLALQASASREGRWFFCARKSGHIYGFDCPYGKVGDRLWVRETWSHTGQGVWTIRDARMAFGGKVVYRADGERPGGGWWPSIHMPREFSRITLEITDVRVERLIGISESDCWAEGIEAVDGEFDDQIFEMALRIGCTFEDAKPTFACLWESINGPGSWEANPWVWAITFGRVA